MITKHAASFPHCGTNVALPNLLIIFYNRHSSLQPLKQGHSGFLQVYDVASSAHVVHLHGYGGTKGLSFISVFQSVKTVYFPMPVTKTLRQDVVYYIPKGLSIVFLFFSNFYNIKQQNHENYARFTVSPQLMWLYL